MWVVDVGVCVCPRHMITPSSEVDRQVEEGSKQLMATSIALSLTLGAALGGVMGAGAALGTAQTSVGAFAHMRRRSHQVETLRLWQHETAQQAAVEDHAPAPAPAPAPLASTPQHVAKAEHTASAQQLQRIRRAERARAKRKKAALANGVVAAGSSSEDDSEGEEGVDGFDDGRCVTFVHSTCSAYLTVTRS